MSEKKQDEITLEEAFEQLDELIEQMEENDLPLEDSFALYKKGVQLVEYCNKKIEKVECDIKKVTE